MTRLVNVFLKQYCCHPELVSGSLKTIISMRDKTYYVYILTNYKNKTLYIGLTNNLERRIYQHKNELIEGFSKRYKLKKLVYYEEFKNIIDALAREKQLKNWHREWKINLVKGVNPEFKDLAEEWYEEGSEKRLDPETSSG